MDTKELMLTVVEEYKRLIQDKKYMQPTKEQSEIIALSAKLVQTETAHAQLATKFKQLNKDKQTGGPPAGRKQYGKDEAWMTENQDNKATMHFNDKDWIWCKFHKKWGKHTLADCAAKKKKDAQAQTQPADQSGQTAAAIAAILEQEDSSDDDEDDG